MNSPYKLQFVLLLISIFSFRTICFATPSKYSITAIPQNLLANSKAVIREKEQIFEVSAPDKAIEKVKLAITILNDNGIENSIFTQFYDKFSSIRKIKAIIYDGSGKVLKTISPLDYRDYSAISGYSLYEDYRVKFINPDCRATPFTVEFTYEISYDGLLYYPNWQVYDDYNVSVEKSTFKVIIPKGFNIRYLEKNVVNHCRKSEEDNKYIYTWTAENMPGIKNEPFSLKIQELTPVVYTAPNDFEIGGYKGNLETWSSFGKWIYSLSENRTELNQETKEKIDTMISDKQTVFEKVRTLYEFMQNKVRYVNIKVGIGGWQPLDAETVNRLSYGDCKALSNFMKSMLDYAGIRSYYTLVMAGEEAVSIETGFPSSQFNHAMLCIPVGHDTLWLECTNQHIPCGYIGTFTDDRPVFVVSDSGGRIVRTRSYSIDENRKITVANVRIDSSGSADVTMKISYNGTYYDKILPVMLSDDIDRKNSIRERFHFPGFRLLSTKFTERKNILPEISEEDVLTIQNYGSITGKNIIIIPNLISRIRGLPSGIKDRKSPVIIRRSTYEIDTIKITLPERFRLEQLPGRLTYSSKFGDYSAEMMVYGKELIYVRSFKLFKGTYPVIDYGSFVEFLENVSVADEIRLNLVYRI